MCVVASCVSAGTNKVLSRQKIVRVVNGVQVAVMHSHKFCISRTFPPCAE